MRIRKPIIIRRAKAADVENIRALQHAAFRIETRFDYEPAEVESYLTYAGAVESSLIADGTYFVAEIEGEIVACGSWSTRSAAYEAHLRSGTVAPFGSPVIRGIFVDPTHSATGVAQRLITALEDDISSFGHAGAYLATTYTGMPFYTAAGYKPCNLVSLAFPDGHELHGVAMTKELRVGCAVAA